jgi:hypothetical protein
VSVEAGQVQLQFTMRHLEDFVTRNHPLRAVRKMVNQALKNIEPQLHHHPKQHIAKRLAMKVH